MGWQRCRIKLLQEHGHESAENNDGNCVVQVNMTKVNALLMNAADNVVTTVAEIAKGKDVCYMDGSECVTLKAKEDIPYCHKVALTDLPEGGEV